MNTIEKLFKLLEVAWPYLKLIDIFSFFIGALKSFMEAVKASLNFLRHLNEVWKKKLSKFFSFRPGLEWEE